MRKKVKKKSTEHYKLPIQSRISHSIERNIKRKLVKKILKLFEKRKERFSKVNVPTLFFRISFSYFYTLNLFIRTGDCYNSLKKRRLDKHIKQK